MKSNLKLILSSIILIIVNSAFAQSKYFHIKNITNGNELSFLVLSNKKDSLAAEKINQMLQLSELELLNGYQKKNIFEKIGVKFDGETLSNGKVNISYSIISNNFKFISIKFDETFCDMTCHYWVRYYNFNSANGYLMQLKDFFTEKGFAAFKKKILKKRTEKFNKELLKENTQKEHFSYVLACIKD
ncbi:MAG: hypothetical protein FWF72_00790, partial [Paludibacter sp.]|nr:hypothetical protein [Paludibacter sp.]